MANIDLTRPEFPAIVKEQIQGVAGALVSSIGRDITVGYNGIDGHATFNRIDYNLELSRRNERPEQDFTD